MENYKVYRHIFPNGKIYIGITKQNVNVRWNSGYGYKRSPKMWNAIKKYKWINIKHEILFDNLSKEEAERKEIELISKFKSDNTEYGYNIAKGGNTVGTVSEETKLKISKSQKGIKCPQRGFNNSGCFKKGQISYWKNKKLSKEHKNKLSLSHIGKNIGHNVSEETRQKISIANKNHKINYKFKEKCSKKVLCVEKNIIYSSLHNAMNITGIDYRNISAVCNGKRKTTGGFHWRFI